MRATATTAGMAVKCQNHLAVDVEIPILTINNFHIKLLPFCTLRLLLDCSIYVLVFSENLAQLQSVQLCILCHKFFKTLCSIPLPIDKAA